MDLISHPFRLGPGGSVATVRQGSPDAQAEAIAVLVLTHPGEREQVPSLGVRDPRYYSLDPSELSSQVAMHGPDVAVIGTRVTFPAIDHQRVDIEFADRPGTSKVGTRG